MHVSADGGNSALLCITKTSSSVLLQLFPDCIVVLGLDYRVLCNHMCPLLEKKPVPGAITTNDIYSSQVVNSIDTDSMVFHSECVQTVGYKFQWQSISWQHSNHKDSRTVNPHSCTRDIAIASADNWPTDGQLIFNVDPQVFSA